MEEKRVLYYVKILAHTSEELGSLGKAIARAEKRDMKAHDEMAYHFWRKVRQAIKDHGLNTPEICEKLHIYVDGLTAQVKANVEEFLLKLTKALIGQGVPQYLIIEKLMERGAKIHDTESQALLIEEYNMWQKVAQGIPSKPGQKERLLEERDKFIANIINRTLPLGEIGILFIGALHDVAKELDELEEAAGLISPLKVIYL